MLRRLAPGMRRMRAMPAPLRRALSSNKDAKGLQEVIYKVFMGSNIAYSSAVIGVAIFGGMAYDSTFEAMWKANNRGKLFEDVIEQRFPNPPEGTEEEEEEEDDDDDDDDE
uniref:Cytochrome b-c1 complex subunit 9 n=1 Tax=Lotharella oceanica TaxID=641309 RepID=A0A7S2XFV3_9EUKA|mmetsp:Transcript_4414/g.8849  ORF Transcript_4414/g.8849 Transcript_4414/m.8849 type:complete len:111 (+) Transcript_4414:25-357(+)